MTHRLGRRHAEWLLENFSDDARLSDRQRLVVAVISGGASATWEDCASVIAGPRRGKPYEVARVRGIYESAARLLARAAKASR